MVFTLYNFFINPLRENSYHAVEAITSLKLRPRKQTTIPTNSSLYVFLFLLKIKTEIVIETLSKKNVWKQKIKRITITDHNHIASDKMCH